MARLPVPGADPGQWGQILNDYLSAAHNSDGTLKDNAVSTNTIQDNSVSGTKLQNSTVNVAKLNVGSGSDGQVLTKDSAATGGFSWVSGGGVPPDASASVKGLVQLTGDLGGTAASPTVPGLAAKANDSAVVHTSGNETISGIKNFTGTLQISGQAAVATNDARLSDPRTPSNASVTPAKLVADVPATGEVLSYNGTGFEWVPQSGGGGDPTMGGDLSGVASNAQLVANAVGSTEIAANAVISAKINDGAVTTTKLGTTGAPTSGQVLSYNGSALAWTSAGSSDPTMGGDLSGVASNAQIVAGAVGSTELATDAVTTIKVTDNNITEPKLAITNSPSTSQVLSWNGSAMAWAAPATGSGGPGSVGTILVASNDAPAAVKAYADYVCNGTNDEAKINLAIDDASPLNSRNSLMPAGAKQTGVVQLTGGRFNISAPITMRTAVWLRGMGFGTELRAVSNNGTGMITLASPKDHLCRVSDMYIYGNGPGGGTCNGIDFDMSDGTPSTSGYPDTNSDADHLIHDLYIDQFMTGTRHAIYMHSASSANNRGNILDRIQIRDSSGCGIWFFSATDSFISNCHVGGSADSAYKIAGGNTKLTNCKSFYSGAIGFNITSGRATISGCEMQDDVVGMSLASSGAAVSGVVVDTCQNDGIIVGTSHVSLTGFSIFVRGGGLYTTQANGLRFSGTFSDIECIGRVNPSSITTPVSGAPVALSYMRVMDGTSVVSVG